ncbi:RanBP1 domain-domain-containing protein, partial [Catenaria anguillulae PL171]
MRREGTHKVCLNHYLSPEIPWQFAFNTTTAVTWHTPAEASDSERPPEHAVLALRVKHEEKAKALLAKVNECREWNAKVAAGKEMSGSPRAPRPIERDGAESSPSAGQNQTVVCETVAGSGHEDNERQDEEQVEDFEPKANFEPVVYLEQVVDEVTGEEGEDQVFSERAVLFRYDPIVQTWKERGNGTLRILFNPNTNHTRIVMRRAKVLKVCANHLITRNMKLEPFTASQKSAGRTLMWMTLADVSDNDAGSTEPKKETFAARFATVELAAAFKAAF